MRTGIHDGPADGEISRRDATRLSSPIRPRVLSSRALSVRIRFTEDAGTVLMTVTDAELVLTARRKQGAKRSSACTTLHPMV